MTAEFVNRRKFVKQLDVRTRVRETLVKYPIMSIGRQVMLKFPLHQLCKVCILNFPFPVFKSCLTHFFAAGT